jgi:hypothetical protein
VSGRQAVERFIEFAREDLPSDLPTASGPYELTIEVLLVHKRGWKPLARFLLHTEIVTKDDAQVPIVRSNDPSWRP